MTDGVDTHIVGALGRITLNRPAALNSLTHDMVQVITAILDRWQSDDRVRAVLIDGAGDRGLCAGGDLYGIYADAIARGTRSERLWADEYRLCSRIARYPKPYVALMDGLVLGGGVGVSAHGSIRVVTERSRIGMPETTIGFVPDVGGTYLLSRSPGLTGHHVAMTGMHVSGSDAIMLGLADYFLPSQRLNLLIEHLAESQFADPAEVVRSLAVDPPASAVATQRHWIDQCYGAQTPREIIDRLRGTDIVQAVAAADDLESKSPTALIVTLRALRSARELRSLESVLDQEYRISLRAFAAPDFTEGIRAQIIDKDKNPAWLPATLADVDAATIDEYFSLLGSRELGLDSCRGIGPGLSRSSSV